MRSCWGGAWPNSAQHQPPPPNAPLHPGPSKLVPRFKPRFHTGPGFDLKPNKLSAREREWAGSRQPPVDHIWLTDIDVMSRSQLSSLSALEWILGVYFDSVGKASPTQLQALRDFAVKELHQSIDFGGAILASSTLARRKAILDGLGSSLSQNTRNWLQLQPVSLQSSLGMFGPASASVPEIMRQQPVPKQTPAGGYNRRPQPRATRQDRPRGQARSNASRGRGASSTYTPTAAATEVRTSEPRQQQRQSRGSKSNAAKAKQRT